MTCKRDKDEIPRLLFAQHFPLQIPQIQNKIPVAAINQFMIRESINAEEHIAKECTDSDFFL